MKINILRRRKLGAVSTNGITFWLSKLLPDDEIKVVRNWLEEADGHLIFRWGCTSTTKRAEIFNYASNIHRITNKPGFRKHLIDNGVQCPETFFSKEDAHFFLLANHEARLIGRKEYHAQGRNAKIINDKYDLSRDNSSAYWSEILDKQQEFRVFCVNGRVACVAEKIPEDKSVILWNRARTGAPFINVRWGNWSMDVIKEALKVHQLSELHHEGVDIMLVDGRPYVLETNSAPSLTSEYRHKCFAKAFYDTIIKIKNDEFEVFPMPTRFRNWKDVIHPSVWKTKIGEDDGN